MEKLKLIITLVSVLVLCACAGTHPVEETPSNSKVKQYQGNIHANARNRNMDIHWINTPDEEDMPDDEDQAEEDDNS
jgi:hypothetical protein